jgi:MgtE intracellular N domain
MRLPVRQRAQSVSRLKWKKPTSSVRDYLAVRHALSGQVISLAQLVGRPIRDPQGTIVSRVNDVVVRWDGGAAHPPVTGILASVRKGYTFVAVQDALLGQTGVRLRAAKLVVGTPVRAVGDVALARDVLDRQLVDVAGVQVVRAADVYLVNGVNGWELAGVDVGLRALFRRMLPRRWTSATPFRSIDWADLQAFVPRFDETSGVDPSHPAASAGVTGSSIQFASPAADLRRLRAKDVAALLQDLDRPQQAQLAALAEPSEVRQALGKLDPTQLQALLSELDEADRSRLMAMLPPEGSS